MFWWEIRQLGGGRNRKNFSIGSLFTFVRHYSIRWNTLPKEKPENNDALFYTFIGFYTKSPLEAMVESYLFFHKGLKKFAQGNWCRRDFLPQLCGCRYNKQNIYIPWKKWRCLGCQNLKVSLWKKKSWEKKTFLIGTAWVSLVPATWINTQMFNVHAKCSKIQTISCPMKGACHV